MFDATEQQVIIRQIDASKHPAVVYLASLGSKHSRDNMQRHLTHIARFLTGDNEATAFSIDWSAVRYHHSAAIRSRLMEDYAASTVNAMLSALRAVLKEAWRLGQMSAEDYHRAVDIASVRGESLPAGRHIAYGEIQAVATVCFQDKSPAGARDSAIIGILTVCGLRRSEIVNLKLSDVDIATGELKIRQAKRNKARIVWLRGGALLAVKDWLMIREAQLQSEALFVPVNKSGKQQDRRMSSQAIYKLIKKRGQEAAIKDFSPHDLRRTMITDLLANDTDVLTVQKIVGHASADTTRRYDRRGEQQKQQAAARLHYPHHSRFDQD